MRSWSRRGNLILSQLFLPRRAEQSEDDVVFALHLNLIIRQISSSLPLPSPFHSFQSKHRDGEIGGENRRRRKTSTSQKRFSFSIKQASGKLNGTPGTYRVYLKFLDIDVSLIFYFAFAQSVAVRERRLLGVLLLGERVRRDPATLTGQLRVVWVSGNRSVRVQRSPEPRRQHQVTQVEAGHHCHKGPLATCTLPSPRDF